MKSFQKKSILIVLVFCLFSITGYPQIAASEEELEDQISKADSLWQQSEYDKAILIYEKVLDKAPESIKVYEKLVKAYAYLGMFDMAEERAAQLYNGRVGENCRLGLIYTMQNRTDDALTAVANMMLNAEPGQYFPGAPTCAMFFQTKAGEYKKAWSNIEKCLTVEEAGLWKFVFLMYGIHVNDQLGNIDTRDALLVELKEGMNYLEKSGALDQLLNQPRASFIYQNLAAYHSIMGDNEKALANLQKHYEDGGRQYYWIKNVSPFYEEMRGDPKFKAVLDAMKEDIDEMRDNVEAKLLSK